MRKYICLWKPITVLNFSLLLMVMLILNSCGPLAGAYIPVSYGKIITDGVEITDANGMFTLRSGDVWTPPFQNETGGYKMNYPEADMVNFYKTAIVSMGAKKVMVKVPYQSEPLYGVLLLSKIYPNSANSAVARSYQISIPKSYVDAAQNGKVSVLYEYYDTGQYDGSLKIVPKTWVLWLSDIPFSAY